MYTYVYMYIYTYIYVCIYIHMYVINTALMFERFFIITQSPKKLALMLSFRVHLAFNWSFWEIFTVGFGDIAGTNAPERIFVIVAMWVGTLLFSFVISEIESFVVQFIRTYIHIRIYVHMDHGSSVKVRHSFVRKLSNMDEFEYVWPLFWILRLGGGCDDFWPLKLIWFGAR